MDTLTHAVMGMAVGELALGKKVGKKALLWGAVVANLPDLDGVFQYLFSPAASTMFHRGISHSMLLLVLFAPLVALGINYLYKGDKKTYGGWFRLVFFAWASHLTVDIFNSYGTGLLEPFSSMRIAYDSIGITDLFFILPLLVSAILSLIRRKMSKLSVVIPTIALSMSFMYLGFTIGNKQHVENFAKFELERQGINYTRVLTSPLPITNFGWMVVVEDESGFWKGAYSVTTGNFIRFDYIPKNHHLATDIEPMVDFKTLQQFSKGYYALRKGDDGDLILSDLRFGSLTDNTSDNKEDGGLNFTIQTQTDDGKLLVKRSHPNRNITPSSVLQYIRWITQRS